MYDETVTLWTIQFPDFDLTSGRVDHNRSEYFLTVSGVKNAYQELWHRLNTPDGQTVWCYTSEDGIVKTGVKKIRWELCMPKKEIICYLDSLVWNRILGIRCIVGNTMRNQWVREAIKLASNNSDVYYKKLEDDFWNRKPKTGSWWDELFVQNTGECVDAIIRHPVPDKFVNGRIIWQVR